MSLHEIGLKYNADKATFHKYLDFYEKNIDRDKVKRFLEIGVWAGSSIKMWREWFDKDTIVEGWDIDLSDYEEVKNCDVRLVDQMSRDQMLNNITGIYDVILDDGAHRTETIETSFSCLFKYCKYYIIEDLHAPWSNHHWGNSNTGYDTYVQEGDVPTIELIQKLESEGWLSNYARDYEKEYIDKNAKLVDIFWRGDFAAPLSMTAILANKEYL